MADPNTNSQNNNITDSIKQNAIIEGLDQTADKVYDSITKSFSQGEITTFEASISRNVPRSLWNLAGFLDKAFSIGTLFDIFRNKDESIGQKILTDSPRFAPRPWGLLGEIWNSAMDFILKITPPKKLPLEMMWQTKDGLTTGQEPCPVAPLDPSDPFNEKGFLNDQSSDNQAFDDFWNNQDFEPFPNNFFYNYIDYYNSDTVIFNDPNYNYQQRDNSLSDFAYGMSYEHFNTYQNDPFENSFLDATHFYPGSITGDASQIQQPPPTMMYPYLSDAETYQISSSLRSRACPEETISMAIDNYNNGDPKQLQFLLSFFGTPINDVTRSEIYDAGMETGNNYSNFADGDIGDFDLPTDTTYC